MSAELLALGVSHKTAPVALRERLALQEGQAVAFVEALVADEPLSEAVAISTCNRTELYVVAANHVAGAYVVFVAMILIYVVIMAIRLQRIEREVAELDELAARKEREESDHREEAGVS